MVKVKFIKRHPNGINEGSVVEVSKEISERWLEQGYVELPKEPKPKLETKPKAKATRKPRAKKIETKEGGEVK
jgi:hypothetical protein